MTSSNTFESNVHKINQYWPQFSWNDSLRNLWTQKLKGLNQDRLSLALDEVRASYSSEAPQLKWIQEKYSVIVMSEPVSKTVVHSDESGLTDEDRLNLASSLEDADDETRERIAHRLRQATGLKLDWSVPVLEWSNVKIMLASVVLNET